MATILKNLLTMSLSGSIVILLVLALRQVLKKAPEKGTCRSFVGYYYKADQGDLFGVVQAVWEINQETSVTVNMLVNCDGTVTQISTEELNQRLQGAR